MEDLLQFEPDGYEPNEEDERDFWNGEGHITFYVIQNTPEVFEIEIEDYSGCAHGMQEITGIEYYIKDVWCLHMSETFREGVNYTLHNLTVQWFRGDGWTTDDDVEYDFESITSEWKLKTRVHQKISNWWWRSIGWRLK